MVMTERTDTDWRSVTRGQSHARANPSKGSAGLIPRGLALAIDYIILFAACSGLYGILGITKLGDDSVRTLGSLLSFALIVLYFATLESGELQATIGKLVMGLKVTDLEGARLSFLRGLARFFAKLLSLVPFVVGFVMAGFTERNQALHDLLAGTQVVRVR